MANTYGTIVTDVGAALIASAVAAGTKVNITTLAVGDGNGAYYMPVSSMTALKNEKWSGVISSAAINAQNANIIDVVAVVPADVGGWTIREMCLRDASGNMIAICNTPDTQKVVITTGAAGEIELTMQIKVSSAAAVTFTIDPNVVTATKSELAAEAVARKAADEALQVNINAKTDVLINEKTVYVSTSGSDTAGNGTSASPYATITKALSTIPKICDKYKSTVVISGGTYNEIVTIGGYLGGAIGSSGLHFQLLGDVTIQGMYILGSTMYVQNDVTRTLTTGYLVMDHADAEFLASCNITVTSEVLYFGNTAGISVDSISRLYASGVVTVKNTTTAAVRCSANSNVYFGTITGSNNTGIGLLCGSNAQISYMVSTIIANTRLGGNGTIVNLSMGKTLLNPGSKSVFVSTTGSDTTGDGTVGNPFATIQKAIDTAPRVLGGDNLYITISPGTYSGNVYIGGFSGAMVIIQGINIDSYITINGNISIYEGSSVILANNIHLTINKSSDTTDAVIAVYNRATLFKWGGSTITLNCTYNSVKRDGLLTDGSAKIMLWAGALTVNNAATAVGGHSCSELYIDDIQGTGNNIGIDCNAGSSVGYYSKTISASTATSTSSGGRIYSGSQTNVPNY